MGTEPVAPPGTRDRAPTVDDLDAVLAVITACDIEDVGEPDYSRGDLRSDWGFSRFDLAADARVLEDEDGRIRAYIAIRQLDPGRSFWGDLYVHPDVRGGPAERWAIVFAERRAADLSIAADASLHLYTEDGSELAALLAALGYEDVRRMWRMSIDLDGDVPAPEGPPSGIEIRTFEPDAARALHGAVEESFADHRDHHEETFEEWSTRKLDHPEFDPSTWWVAWDGDEVAGMHVATCWVRYERSVGSSVAQ